MTRQSNTQIGSKAGGGAIYGCRGAAGGAGSGSAPCLRASNLAAGFAFEFAAEGDVVGQISVGDGTTARAKAEPFTTNATRVATGLNADQVDGRNASDIAAGVSVGGVDVEADSAAAGHDHRWPVRLGTRRCPEAMPSACSPRISPGNPKIAASR